MFVGLIETTDGLFMKVGLVGVNTLKVSEYAPNPTLLAALTL